MVGKEDPAGNGGSHQDRVGPNTHDQMFLEGSEKCPVVAQPPKAVGSDKGRSTMPEGPRKRHRRGRTKHM